MGSDLLIEATEDLLRGWTGPALVWPGTGPVMWFDCIVWDGRPVDVEQTQIPIENVRLDLSRAEVRDRVARCLADLRGLAIRWTTAPRFRYGYSRSACLDGPEAAFFWDAHPDMAGHPTVPALADLDPNDDTRLPDGSRRVDALALARCWEASRG